MPSFDQVLEFCADDPVERVFLEDVARRGFGRFLALERAGGALDALCLLGTNLVPAGPTRLASLLLRRTSPCR